MNLIDKLNAWFDVRKTLPNKGDIVIVYTVHQEMKIVKYEGYTRYEEAFSTYWLVNWSTVATSDPTFLRERVLLWRLRPAEPPESLFRECLG